ncbi:hypothetical protein E4U30_007197, partial [Claviceps sp. LM220 group G6]
MSEVQYPATPANKHQVPVTRGAPKIPRHHEAYHDQFGNLQLHDPNPEQVNAKPVPVHAEPQRVIAKLVPEIAKPVPAIAKPVPVNVEPVPVVQSQRGPPAG